MRLSNSLLLALVVLLISALAGSATGNSFSTDDLSYGIVETGQISCYDTDGNVITCPEAGEPLYGQDAQFEQIQFSFVDNGDGTITDLNTGLMWQKTPAATSCTWQQAMDYCESLSLAGYDDWRAPSLKELYSISNFSQGWPYLNTDYFDIAGSTVSKDEQYWSSNFYYVGTTHGGQQSAFGVNHGTGHIKAYPAEVPGPMGNYVRAVRGDAYGNNDFVDNADGTITDNATGLMWMQDDLSTAVDWEHALTYADTVALAGYGDWRLPNVKELQSIVDYSGVFPAIDSLFSCTSIINEGGDPDYGYYWSSTSALFNAGTPFYYAWYVAFGYAVDPYGDDTHGAGAVRFDTKVEGGPAGEGGERYYNYVRCVRDVSFSSLCGDANGSGSVDIDDAVYLIGYIFSGGLPPEPIEVGDVDCSESVDIDDVVYMIAYIFSGGPMPCDPSGDGLPDC